MELLRVRQEISFRKSHLNREGLRCSAGLRDGFANPKLVSVDSVSWEWGSFGRAIDGGICCVASEVARPSVAA